MQQQDHHLWGRGVWTDAWWSFRQTGEAAPLLPGQSPAPVSSRMTNGITSLACPTSTRHGGLCPTGATECFVKRDEAQAYKSHLAKAGPQSLVGRAGRCPNFIGLQAVLCQDREQQSDALLSFYQRPRRDDLVCLAPLAFIGWRCFVIAPEPSCRKVEWVERGWWIFRG